MRAPIWLVEHGRAHLILERSAPLSWCGLTLARDCPEAEYQPRCQNCVIAVNRFHVTATTPLPDLLVETVVVTVTRPSESTESVADYLRRTLSRKKSWKDVTVVSQEIAGVEE